MTGDMAQTAIAPIDIEHHTTDQLVLLHGVSWSGYVQLRKLLDSPGVRLTYLQGALEIMSPSSRHEFLKTLWARLVETFAVERGIPLEGYGSTTFRRQAKERGLEPDECYCVGRKLGKAPDIAIEVVLTSGSIDKLAVYAGLDVAEVWFWRKERFEIHVRHGQGYRLARRSRKVPSLDLEHLARFMKYDEQHAAVLAYRAALGGGHRTPRLYANQARRTARHA
jgi:Uma2 family endonuclease